MNFKTENILGRRKVVVESREPWQRHIHYQQAKAEVGKDAPKQDQEPPPWFTHRLAP
jgi:hypothetical protein